MSKTKEYYMKNNQFGDLEREYLFNDILAQEDSREYEEFINSPDYKESNIVKKAKIILGHERKIQHGLDFEIDNGERIQFEKDDSRTRV